MSIKDRSYAVVILLGRDSFSQAAEIQRGRERKKEEEERGDGKRQTARIYPKFDVSRSETSPFLSANTPVPFQRGLYDARRPSASAFIGRPSCVSACISISGTDSKKASKFIYKYRPRENDTVVAVSPTENCKTAFTHSTTLVFQLRKFVRARRLRFIRIRKCPD